MFLEWKKDLLPKPKLEEVVLLSSSEAQQTLAISQDYV